MNETLKSRLKEDLDTVTTASDYGDLLKILSFKTNIPVDDLREGKGSWTYRGWNKELKKYGL